MNGARAAEDQGLLLRSTPQGRIIRRTGQQSAHDARRWGALLSIHMFIVLMTNLATARLAFRECAVVASLLLFIVPLHCTRFAKALS